MHRLTSLTCKICRCEYSEHPNDREPVIIPACGHTVCFRCASKNFENRTRKMTCPIDGREFRCDGPQTLAPNRALIEVLRELKWKEQGEESEDSEIGFVSEGEDMAPNPMKSWIERNPEMNVNQKPNAFGRRPLAPYVTSDDEEDAFSRMSEPRENQPRRQYSDGRHDFHYQDRRPDSFSDRRSDGPRYDRRPDSDFQYQDRHPDSSSGHHFNGPRYDPREDHRSNNFQYQDRRPDAHQFHGHPGSSSHQQSEAPRFQVDVYLHNADCRRGDSGCRHQ